jgi:uncharacterized protein (TIGR00369 family)
VITWEDQAPLARQARELTGIETLRGVAARQLPQPAVSSLLGWDALSEFDEGRVVVSFLPHESHYSPLGAVHGGVALSLLDSAMGLAAYSVLPARASYSTLQLKVGFLRVIVKNVGRVRCEGTVEQVADDIIQTTGRITDDGGRLFAHGTGMCRMVRE